MNSMKTAKNEEKIHCFFMIDLLCSSFDTLVDCNVEKYKHVKTFYS